MPYETVWQPPLHPPEQPSKDQQTSKEVAPIAVGVSGLLTTVIPNVKRVRDRLWQRGLGQVKVLAGGAVLKQASAESLNVDFRAETAFDATHYLDRINGNHQ